MAEAPRHGEAFSVPLRRRGEAKSWPEAAQKALREYARKNFQRPKDLGSRKTPLLTVFGKMKLSAFLPLLCFESCKNYACRYEAFRQYAENSLWKTLHFRTIFMSLPSPEASTGWEPGVDISLCPTFKNVFEIIANIFRTCYMPDNVLKFYICIILFEIMYPTNRHTGF